MAKYPCTKCKLSDRVCSHQNCEKWRSWVSCSWLEIRKTWQAIGKADGVRTVCITSEKKGGAAVDESRTIAT